MEIITIIFCMLLITSCNQRTAKHDNATCRIDLKKVDFPSFYDYFSKIEITPLESSKESLIKDVTEYTYHAGKLYIFDRNQKKIFVFDNEGKLFNIINMVMDLENIQICLILDLILLQEIWNFCLLWVVSFDMIV